MENGCNRVEHRNGHLIGSSFNISKQTWQSTVSIKGKRIQIGTYNTEREASLAYCRCVLQNGLVRREFLPKIFTDEELYAK